MMVVARLSISLSLSIITMSITSIMAVSMVIVSWLSSGSCFGFPLSIVAMTISTIHDVHSHDGSSQAQHQPLSFHNNRVHNLHNGCIHGDSILAQQRQLLRLPS